MPETAERNSRFAALPGWAGELIELYESGAASQFILYGNTADRLLLRTTPQPKLGSLRDFLFEVILPSFQVVITFDLGSGVRIERGSEIFSDWPAARELGSFPKTPRPAIETLTSFFRYCVNLARLNRPRISVACIINSAHLVAPAAGYSTDYDLSALASLMRSWAEATEFTEHSLATFLIAENLSDLHPLLVNNPRVGRTRIPLPTDKEIEQVFNLYADSCPAALSLFQGKHQELSKQLVGASISAVERLVKTKQYQNNALAADDLVQLKKQIVENDCNGLIDFMESDRSFADLYGQEKIKAWLKQDVQLWRNNDLGALPMGYLFCGPVGTGKTFLVNCLAGEAGVPVVKLKNFRDRWVGSTEGNLEKIFRLLHALGRCIVFIDEADQALGRRDGGSGDSNVSGRVYSMMAEEMSNTKNRGKIVWILASSRPDLIEVDLKRPGRVDVKIPLFPSTTPEEGFQLMQAMCKRMKLPLEEKDFAELRESIPLFLTPGSAEALVVKVYRLVRTQGHDTLQALKECLSDYQNPIAPDVMKFQIEIAAREASYLDFVPQQFRPAK